MDPGPVFLIGFMATGKSTVGARLAERMGRRFIDLDGEIERAAGRPIAQIFREDGEAWFRLREAEALAATAREHGAVVACGGGAPGFGDNLQTMRRAGLVVGLRAGLDEIRRRLGDLASRPLAGPQLDGLFRARAATYGAADFSVDTEGRAPDEIAGEVARRAALRMGDIFLRAGARGHPIALQPLASAGALAEECFPAATARLAIITDENVAAAGHVEAVRRALQPRFATATVSIPPGEPSKRLAEVERVAEACLAAGLDRRSAIVAVGGGVVGDLAGFVAAVFLRGVPVAQVPTTLLAMVDSAIGGKTGVDLPAGKNLVGAFWQPSFVLADVATLATLPGREVKAALAEVLKYGLLFDEGLVEDLERTGGLGDDPAALVARCARFKARIVAEDERETTGARALLNLGHTVGHAIEAASQYRLLHGEAVGLGLHAAARVSHALGLCGPELPARVAGALRRLGLDDDLAPWLGDDALARIGVDKKRAGGKIGFIALEAPGRPRRVELAPEELATILRSSGPG